MKLSAATYIVLGLFFGLCALIFGYSQAKPNWDEASALDKNADQCRQEAAKQHIAEQRVKDAERDVKKAGAQWAAIASVKTPPDTLAQGGIDISVNGAQLIVDSRVFRNSMQNAVNKQFKVGGIKPVSNGPRVPDPGIEPSTILADYYNYPVISYPVVIFDLGTVTVEGTYSQIMANVRGWANMPHYLAVSDGLRIDGTSPHMRGTYAISLVGFIRGGKLFMGLPETPGASNSQLAGFGAGNTGQQRGPQMGGMGGGGG